MRFSFSSRDIAIDLGTANVLTYVKGKSIVSREPSVVAIRNDGSREILAVGSEAKAMIGRTPGNIIAFRPLQDGVIADFEVTEAMLRYFIKKALHDSFSLMKPFVVICVPYGVTEVERRAVEDAARSAGARDAFLVEEPMAAAIGAGLPVQEPVGTLVVDIGGGTTEVAVISLGGIVTCRSIRIGGDKMDEAIVNYMKHDHNVAIGDRTAEEIKINIGSAYQSKDELSMEIRGRDLLDGLPVTMRVTSRGIYTALREPVSAIIEAIKQTLEMTPPELSADIMERGIVLTGGGALLSGLDILVNRETGIPCYVAENPMDCVVLGSGKIVEEIDILRDIEEKAKGY